MIYCAVTAAFGWHTFCDALPNGENLLPIFGLVCYIVGIICGQIVEDRLNERIEKLEKGNKND